MSDISVTILISEWVNLLKKNKLISQMAVWGEIIIYKLDISFGYEL